MVMQRQQFTTDEPSDGFVTGDNTVTSLERDTTGGQLLSETASAAAEQSIEAEQSGVVEEALEVGQSEEVGRVTAAIRREVRARHKRNVLFTVGSVLAYIPAFYFLHLIGSKGDPKVAHYDELTALRFVICFALPALLLPLLMTVYARKLRKRTQKTTGKIDALEDLTLVGPLAEVLAIDDLAVRRMAKANLTRLLPRLRASDVTLLNAYQRKHLNRFVGAHLFEIGHRDIRELWSKQARQRDTEFQLAILKAYEQVGDAESLPFVKSIAHPIAQQARIVPVEAVEAANRCLPFLIDLAEQDRASKQLLRPSSASDVLPDTLLRPAMHQTNTQEIASLLRAGAAVDAFVAPKRGKRSDE